MTTTSSRDLSTPHTHCTVQTTHRRASQSMNATRLLATSPLVWVLSLANDTILMTSSGPNCQNCFRFFTTGSRPIISESMRPTFAQFSGCGCRWLLWNWIAIALDGRCHGNQFLFIESTHFFRHSDQCVSNFVHSATTRSTLRRCNSRGWPSTRFVDHANTPGNWHFPLGHFVDTRVRRGDDKKCKCCAGRTRAS